MIAGKCQTFAKYFVASSHRIIAKSSTTMHGKRVDISGVYPPILTPFNADANNSLAFDKLEYNMRRWNEIGFAGYVVLGSTGEFPYLLAEERVALVENVRRLAPSNRLVIAGAGRESTIETIEECQRMSKTGADVLMIVTPSYYKPQMTNAALEEHYRKVADASPLPIMLYSVPIFTQIDLSADVIISLSKHPNIIGLKDSGGDRLCLDCKNDSNDARDERQQFQILTGPASALLPALQAGAVGGIHAMCNTLGATIVSIYDEHKKDAQSRLAFDRQAKICKLLATNPNIGSIPALKLMMDRLGFYGGPVRSPLLPISNAEVQKQLENAYANSGLL